MKKQQGFTIIELVVVILLLGILTATALPRFMDVSTQAHGGVVNGVLGGLRTGMALYRASWMAEGQPTTVTTYGNLESATSGYPLAADEVDCLAIYNNLLQVGRPPASSVVYSGTPATLEDLIEGVANTFDVVATTDDETANDPDGCNFYYIGQFRSGNVDNPQSIPVLNYDSNTGEVSIATSFPLNQD